MHVCTTSVVVLSRVEFPAVAVAVFAVAWAKKNQKNQKNQKKMNNLEIL